MDMKYRVEPLGAEMQFLLPSLKLWQKGLSNVSPEQEIEAFFTQNNLMFTVESGNIRGTWWGQQGKIIIGEHVRYTVAFDGEETHKKVCTFLAMLAIQLQEECIYCVRGGQSFLVYPDPAVKADAE